jgi:hypothetical protein
MIKIWQLKHGNNTILLCITVRSQVLEQTRNKTTKKTRIDDKNMAAEVTSEAQNSNLTKHCRQSIIS